MTDLNSLIRHSADIIRQNAGGVTPKLAVILGSGLGAVADLLDEKATISYAALPGFPKPGVQGHEGTLRIGTVNNVPVYFLKGRVHLYEGVGTDALKVMIRTLKTLGVDSLLITNAAGGLHPDIEPGGLMAISDHINFTGRNPLEGPNDDDWGPRFPPQDEAWDEALRKLLVDTAIAAGVDMHQGVYLGMLGPAFETPAEVRMIRTMGADAVGMSTVADNIVARHCGLRCIGISAIVNRAAGMGFEKLSHEQTLEGARLAEKNMAAAIRAFISVYPHNMAEKAA